MSVRYEDWKYFFPDRFVRDFTAAITWPCDQTSLEACLHVTGSDVRGSWRKLHMANFNMKIQGEISSF